jgi:hypothetical protein
MMACAPSNGCPEAVTDLGEGGIPGDRLEIAASLFAFQTERTKDTIRAVDPILVVLDFDAKPAARERVIRIAADAYYPSVPHRGQHCTGIGTIVGARAQEMMLIHDTSRRDR